MAPEPPVPRPVARLFAAELARLKPDARADGLPVSPTGAPCPRIFAVGLLTAVERGGAVLTTEGGKQVHVPLRGRCTEHRGRLSDLTGELLLSATAQEPSAALFLANAETPVLAAATARWTPGGWRAEEVHNSTEAARNRWVVETANRTLDRVEKMRRFLASRGKGFPEAEARPLRAAADGYRLSPRALDELEEEAAAAIRVVAGGPDPEKTLLEFLGRPGSERGLPLEGLLQEAVKAGIARGAAERALGSLLAEGRCFEPKEGVVRKVT